MGKAALILLMPFCFFPQLIGLLPESLDLILLCRQLFGLCSRALPERGQLGHLVSLSLSQQAAFPFGVRDLLVGRLGVFLCMKQGDLQVVDRDLEILTRRPGGSEGVSSLSAADGPELLHQRIDFLTERVRLIRLSLASLDYSLAYRDAIGVLQIGLLSN